MREGTRYTLHPGYAMELTSMANLRERTGKSVDEWVKIVNRDGPETEKERVAWLKANHGFGMNYAIWISARSVGDMGAEAYDPDRLVEEQYSGPKAALRPLYDKLMEIAFSLGPDVTASPTKTTVPFSRKHVFANVIATTRTRIDLGLALKGVETPVRLIDTGGEAKKDRITRRIPIQSLDEIDGEVERWLKVAYDRDA